MTPTNRPPRVATVQRATSETKIALTLALDGSGAARVATGVGFLDHMLTSLAHHAGFDLDLACEGDLRVDDHHTVEDCALAMGEAIDRALGDRRGIRRFGFAYAPLDEALARSVVDLATRPTTVIDLGLTRERLGDLSCENAPHFFGSLATAGRFCLHVDVLRGVNDHHRLEAAFKATALALRQGVGLEGSAGARSTKGVL
ncbi:MAG: imidazoleglycerol-phosphate dehydratase HisB [Phycisphaeraceae bacterium]|nr:imidazoleglycerol-phosphate dehydratase HisB [Phycisphaerae bacterium]MBX3391249.1 imidazoleglycerol-phosphate dehydratase HisB [Phycisphaeraceae bacterium]